MKLPLASPQDKIKALAELDGWRIESDLSGAKPPGWDVVIFRGYKTIWELLPDYLTSYDSIIPLIQKMNPKDFGYWKLDGLTPYQLADALLIETGKFEL